jgi:hypothetical protein
MTAPDPHPVVAHCIAEGYYGVPLPATPPRPPYLWPWRTRAGRWVVRTVTREDRA